MDINDYINNYKKTNLATSLLQGGNAVINKAANNKMGTGEVPSIAFDVKAPIVRKDESVFREQGEDLDEMTNRTISEIRLSGDSQLLPGIYENYRKSLEKLGQERSRYGNQVDSQNASAQAEAANKTAEIEAKDKQYRQQVEDQRQQMLMQANAQNDNVINQSIAGFLNNNLKANEMGMLQEQYGNNPSLFLKSMFGNTKVNYKGND
ncbi:MAG: hypothetical protein ACOCQ4_02040 [bacterium]